jgi:uncharacterized membrane protein
MNKQLTLLVQTSIIFLIFAIIDRIYLSVMSQRIQLLILDVQRTPLVKNEVGTLALNLLLFLAIYSLIVVPEATLKMAFILGLVMQGTMNATNIAMFNNWSTSMSIVDTLFGGLSTLLAVHMGRQIMKSIV